MLCPLDCPYKLRSAASAKEPQNKKIKGSWKAEFVGKNLRWLWCKNAEKFKKWVNSKKGNISLQRTNS